MINELYRLSTAMEEAGIAVSDWHNKYQPIAKATKKAPCIRITLADGKVQELSEVNAELAAVLRKFGSNQGSFPCLNLAPLYRIAEEEKQRICELCTGASDEERIKELRGFCTESNWTGKFLGKYKISLENTVDELKELVSGYEPFCILEEECRPFRDAEVFHRELAEAAFRMLERQENAALAQTILFHFCKPGETEYGKISVALESEKLIETGIPAVSSKFVKGLNRALMAADEKSRDLASETEIDAFGRPYQPKPTDDPMPEVKLAGGFSAILRTMYHGQPCQHRYGLIEGSTYLLSSEVRKKLKAALEWAGEAEREGETWIKTDRQEILFAYPERLPKVPISFVKTFGKGSVDQGKVFLQCSREFLQEFSHGKEQDKDGHADGIQVFILRRIDRGRAKVVYTRETDAAELERCCEKWTEGFRNVPEFPFGDLEVPFPLDVSNTLNSFFQQDGKLVTDKFKPVPRYHGVELLLETALPVEADLHCMAEKAWKIGALCGTLVACGQGSAYDTDTKKAKGCITKDRITAILALTGFLLFRCGIKKEVYMQSFPYLYGQLLKVSDELHALYCKVVRNDDIPPQLAGSSLYQSASEAPVRTLNLLAQRMNPYITWAKSYRLKQAEESWRAGWYLKLYEEFAGQIGTVWKPESRFNDEEKAQLFLGYLAKFPRSEKENDPEEENTNEQ